MMKIALAATAAAIALTALTTVDAAGASAPLIERTKLFGNPSRSQGRISPDGKMAVLAGPQGRVMNIWIAPRADPTRPGP